MKSEYEHPSVVDGTKPVLSWWAIVAHFILANLLAWLVISIPDYNETVQPFVNMISSVIPSVAGMGEMSPNKQWGEIYFLLCLLGSPFYIRFFWRAGAFAYPSWVKEQSPVKFWFLATGLMVLALGLLILLKPTKHSYVSVRAADFIDMLMKDSYFAYGFMAMGLMMVISLSLGAGAKAIQLRISQEE